MIEYGVEYLFQNFFFYQNIQSQPIDRIVRKKVYKIKIKIKITCHFLELPKIECTLRLSISMLKDYYIITFFQHCSCD